MLRISSALALRELVGEIHAVLLSYRTLETPHGFRHLTILDISGAALEAASRHADACDVTWLEADVTQIILPYHSFDLWHDRAVFHFLTDAEDRDR